MEYSPILLFVFNRPNHVRRTIAALQRNTLAAESVLYIYSDAARTPEQEESVNEVRKYIHSINGFKEIHIIERKFLQFMNDALDIYKDEEKVGHIQGCDFTQDTSLPDTFLIKWTGSWGWATWERAWKYFNPDGKVLLEELEKRNLTYTFDFNGRYGFTRMLRRQIEGKNNSWAIRWNASLFLNDILSLNVGKSLVQNEGFDGSGTNCGGGGLYSSNLFMDRIEVKRIIPAIENKEARQAYVRYYARTNSFMAKAIRRIKRTLKGDFGR